MPRAQPSRRDSPLIWRRRLFGVAALGLQAWSAACVSSTDDLYDAPEPPFVPARPDPAREDACTTCAKEACADERTGCLLDQGCRSLLECRGRCADPTCLAGCTATHGYSPFYDDLWRCTLFEHCTDACGSGRNFACVGEYPAPRAEATGFTARFEYKNPFTGLAYAFQGDARDEQFMVGAHARSCLPPDLASSGCQPLDTATVGPDDVFELDLRRHQVTRAWKGLIEVELDDLSGADPSLFRQLGTRDRYLMPPLAADTPFRFYVFWRGWFRETVYKASSDTIDFATAAPLAIYLEDCMGTPAREVSFELPDVVDDEGEELVRVLHQRSDETAGSATDWGSAMVADVPEPFRDRTLSVRAVTEDGDDLAARSDVFVRPGWTTHVWLTPHAR